MRRRMRLGIIANSKAFSVQVYSGSARKSAASKIKVYASVWRSVAVSSIAPCPGRTGTGGVVAVYRCAKSSGWRHFWSPARTGIPMNETATHDAAVAPQDAALLAALGRRSIVLVGMMGAGKSSIGRRLAQRLDLGFVDADAEIEAAAGMTIAEIFSSYGEPDFRSGEARVIARLLDQGHQVLATGG